MRASGDQSEIKAKSEHLLNHRNQTPTAGRNFSQRHFLCTTKAMVGQNLNCLLFFPVCSPPTEPENGGYRCHPSPCHRLTQKTVIEYFCDEGYALKGDYKFLTCQNGEWDSPMQISCRLTQGLFTSASVYCLCLLSHNLVQEM